MNRNKKEDAQYPYAARSGRPSVLADSSYSAWLAWRQRLWRWFVRLAVGVGLLAIILAAWLGFVAYRVAMQAMCVKEVVDRGYSVAYLHQLPGQTDPLPPLLRVWMGDAVWSEIGEVSPNSSGWGTYGYADANIQRVCFACSYFPKLRSFRTEDNWFSCDLIRDWASLERMEELDIKSEKLTDEDLAVIGRMSNLKSLKLHSAKVTAQGIGHLAKLNRLESLRLYSIEFIDSSALPVNGFPALKYLEIEDSPKIGDEAIVAFGSLPAVEEVIINRSRIGDRSLGHLTDGGKVRTLIMNESRVTDAGLKKVGRCAEPFFLHLAGSAVTDEGLRDLRGKQIASLVLDKSRITDEGLRSIAEIKGIGYLSLSGTKISGTGFSYLDRGEALPRLYLEGAALTPEGIATLAKARCTQVDLSRTVVGDAELLLFAGKAELSEVGLNQTKVTISGVRAFYRTRERLLGSSAGSQPLTLRTDFGHFLSATEARDPLTDRPIQLEATGSSEN